VLDGRICHGSIPSSTIRERSMCIFKPDLSGIIHPMTVGWKNTPSP